MAAAVAPGMQRFKEGDLIRIPIPSRNETVLAKVLYIGIRFKHVLGIGVIQRIEPNTSMRNLEVGDIKGHPLYVNIKAGRQWEVIGNRGLNDFEEKLTLRLVGDEVFLKDNFVRAATNSDTQTLHKMYGAGIDIAHEWMSKILDGKPLFEANNENSTD